MRPTPTATSTPPRTSLARLAGFALLFATCWATFHHLTKPDLDSYGDMAENFAWGQEWELGYYKHPPLFAWTSAAWFEVFPRDEWLYYALSYTNVAFALLSIFLLARTVLASRDALTATVLVGLLPTFTFLAGKYNANSALLLWWPLTTLFYVYSLGNRHWAFSLLLGACAALAVLTKYYSLVLLAALFLASLSSLRAYYRSARPYLAATAFVLVLCPHLLWLMHTDFLVLDYLQAQQGERWGEVLYRAFVHFPLAQAAYQLMPALVLGWLLKPSWADIKRNAAEIAHRHPWLWWINIGVPVLAIVAALATKTALSSVWAIPHGFAFTILLLRLFRSAGNQARRDRFGPRIDGMVLAFALFFVAAAPLLGRLHAERLEPEEAVPFRAIDAWIAAEWAGYTDAPLRYVGGDDIANGLVFFSQADRSAVYFPLAHSPWVDAEDLRRHGFVIVCRAGDEDCSTNAERGPAVEPDRELSFSIPPERFWGEPLPRFDGRALFFWPRREPGIEHKDAR